MARPLAALAVLAAAALLAVAVAPASGAGYTRCGTVRVAAKRYAVQVVHVGCVTGKRLAASVMRRRRAPKGWRCTLTNVRQGYAGCRRGPRAFVVVPAG